jgi:hypothetical protein
VAKIAFVAVSVPAGGSRGCHDVVVAVPPDLLLRDEAVGVALADDFVDRLAVKCWSPWASAPFEVVREAAGGGVGARAKGACGI